MAPSASRLTFPLGVGDSVFQLKISIKELQNRVWRRILLPDSISLLQLHKVIQHSFQWRDYHCYRFRKGNRSFSISPFKDLPKDFNDPDEDADKVKISEVLSVPKDRIDYLYDFGDNWEHVIQLEKVIPHVEGRVYPLCTAGRFKGPPEDSGGCGCYEELCISLAKPEDQRDEEQKWWIEWLAERYPEYKDPADFSPAQVTFQEDADDDDEDD